MNRLIPFLPQCRSVSGIFSFQSFIVSEYLLPIWGARGLIISPEKTPDPIHYPEGFVSLDGTEPLEVIYEMVKNNHFIAPRDRIQVIHETHIGLRKLCFSEFPQKSLKDLIEHIVYRHQILSKVLIRRDFWVLSDFNDSELNKSYGLQNLYFDNFKWSQFQWKRFQLFVEHHFPISDHTHLTYDEYLRLIESFSHFEQGVSLRPLLPKWAKLHPPFAASIPRGASLAPLILYKTWLTNFRGPLMIQKALIVAGGCGVQAFLTRYCNVSMVMMTDPSPRCVTSSRDDAKRLSRHFGNIRFQVSEMFPSPESNNSENGYPQFDMIFFSPDQQLLETIYSYVDDPYAPGLIGSWGELETLFENASHYLKSTGVLVICTTNLFGLLNPDKPNPIEYEVKVNRRWLILDYYDNDMKQQDKVTFQEQALLGKETRLTGEWRRQIRSELWILHKVDSLKEFAHIHKIPGAHPPSNVMTFWKFKTLQTHRRRLLRQHIELMGGNWGEYKDRLRQMLQSSEGEPEDEVAEAIRMALDPTFPEILAKRSREVVMRHLEEQNNFHLEVKKQFTDISPRQRFEEWSGHFVGSVSEIRDSNQSF